jgi:phage repressor protein C with HTH and peptisase S24 domain
MAAFSHELNVTVKPLAKRLCLANGYDFSMDINEIRHRNLLFLIDWLVDRKVTKNMDQAQQLGALGASYFSQLKGGKKMGDDTARKIETALGRPHGWMDNPQWSQDRAAEPISEYGENVAYLPSQRLRWVPIRGIAAVNKDGFWFELDGDVAESFAYPTVDSNAYAVRMKGDAYDPIIEAGHVMLIEPGVQLEPSGKVLVKLKDGRCSVRRLLTYDDKEYKLQSLGSSERLTVDAADVEFVHYLRTSFSLHGMELKQG